MEVAQSSQLDAEPIPAASDSAPSAEAARSGVLELPDPVARGLERFADLRRRVLVWEALGLALALCFSGFTILALIDRVLLVEDAIRYCGALLAYAATFAAGAFLLRRALKPRNAETIALEIESRAPQDAVQERLSTTVELASRRDTDANVSVAMVRQVADEAAACIQTLNIDKLIDRRGMRRALRAGAIAAVIVVLLCIPSGLHMRMPYCRAFLPWLNLQRSGSTTVDVLTGSTRVVDGEALDVQARTAGEAVTDAWLETRLPGGHWQPLRMNDDNAPGRYSLKLGPLHEKLEYRVRAGDGRSAVYEIEVLPRPEIANLKLTIQYPAYTGLPPQTFERLNGDLSALKGSHVEMSLSANTQLAAAMLTFPDDRHVPMSVKDAGAAAGFDILEDTHYRLQLRSSDGVSNPDAPLFSIHAVPDLPPQVMVMKPLSDECADVNAIVPLEVRGEDDFGITAMRLVVQSEQLREPLVIPLKKPADGNKVWLIAQPWDLAGLVLNGSETLSYRVEAVDSANQVGRSDERRLRLTGGKKQQAGQLLAQLDDAQKRLNSARKLLASAKGDVNDMRLVFRADDADFQAADRLLLSETLNRVARDVHAAASAIERGLPDAEPGPLNSLLAAIKDCLTRFADTSIRPLDRAATRARSSEAPAIRAALDSMAELLPASELELSEFHEALSAAHRYAGATQLETRASDLHETQSHLLPLLIGASGWTPKGTAFPGLLGEYFLGTNFQTLQRRTIDSEIGLNNKKLPLPATEGMSVRWSGQVLAPKAGRYVFSAPEAGARLSINGKTVLDRCSVQIADDGDKSFALTGDWTEKPAGYKNRFHAALAGTGARAAAWTFTALTPGDYRVSATWVAANKRASNAPYTILDGAREAGTVRINQQLAPAGIHDDGVSWSDLGPPVRIAGNTLTVRLTDAADQTVIADAIRIERVEAQAASGAESGVELTEGWHDITVEFHRTDARRNITLLCTGPDSAKAPIAPERLRTLGLAAGATHANDRADGRVREDMALAASGAAVRHAFLRLHALVDEARGLPRELARLAALQPKPDEPGCKQGADWTDAVAKQTVDLDALSGATEASALPLLTWGDQCSNWVNEYKAVRERYRQAMMQFFTKLANSTYVAAAELRQLQKDSAAAEKAFNELLAAAKLPPEPKREVAMAKADATVRALAEDLRTQATEIAAQLKEADADVRKPLGERQALQALAQRAESLAHGAAADLDRRLNEATTPEALAKTEQNRPNFASDAQALQWKAGELAAMAEREERAVRLRDELGQMFGDLDQARDALKRQPSADAAAAQQSAAVELQQESARLLDAVQNANGQVNGGALAQAGQLSQSPALTHDEDVLKKEAAETLSGQHPDAQQEAAEKKTQTDAATELDKQAQLARTLADSINNDLHGLADAWNGDPAAPLRQAAADTQETGKQLAQLPAETPIAGSDPKLLQAAAHADAARELAEHAAERLALDAEALRGRDATAEQRAKADDLARLAAAIRNEATEQLDPAAALLDAAERDPSQQTQLPKDAAPKAQAAAEELNKFANLAGALNSPDPNAQKAAHEALCKELEKENIAGSVESALKSAQELEHLANDVARLSSPPDPKIEVPAGAERDMQELAKDLGQNPAQSVDSAERQALAEKMGELAQELHAEAQHGRQEADALERANGLAERAREKLKGEGSELAKEMQQAGDDAAQAAKAAPAAAGPLTAMQQTLQKDGAEAGSLAKQADQAPLNELAGKLDGMAQNLQKPIGDVAATLGNPDDPATHGEEKAGTEARDAAGAAADMADELRRAERAERLAQEGALEESGSRQQLEKEVGAALGALEQDPSAVGAPADEVAALKKAAGPGNDPASADARGERAGAERLEQMANRMEKIARGMLGSGAINPHHPEFSSESRTPAADALQVLAEARAAGETGDPARARELQGNAARLLEQAAEAARGQATGMQTAGSNEAQTLAMAKGEGGEKGPSAAKGAQAAANKAPGAQKGPNGPNASNAGSKSGGDTMATAQPPVPLMPPKNLPIDATTWNRLPDDLRRDLLNAAGGRFPAEYESSIRRYFKNVAAIQQDEPQGRERP